jgi:hypothetical protein
VVHIAAQLLAVALFFFPKLPSVFGFVCINKGAVIIKESTLPTGFYSREIIGWI